MSTAVMQMIPCAFCKGKGTDPYGQLSFQSRCEACKGMGEVHVPVPNVRCVYCMGTGSYKTFRCLVCGGAGVVAPVPPPTEPCPSCGGLSYEASSGLCCERCKGHGLVTALPEGTGEGA